MTNALNLAKAGQDRRVIGALVNAYYVDIVVGKSARGAVRFRRSWRARNRRLFPDPPS
jgi:hypothetical protein